VIVELFGYQNVNKGQQLMFHACHDFLRNEGIEGAVSITAGSFNVLRSIQFQNQHGLKHLLHIHGNRYPATSSLLNTTGRLLPARAQKALNLVTRDDVDVIFDFSGFQYSDQWGRTPLELTVRSVQHFKPKGKKFVFLPQSFGPFEDTLNRNNMQTIADGADLIFAREEVSYNYLISVCGKRDTIQIAPDFSNLVAPIDIPDPVIPPCSVLIVPNARMLDKSDLACRDAYLPFLAKCTRFVREKGLLPIILLHEAIEDIAIAKALISEIGSKIPILTHRDPRILKGFIKKAFLLIGSRYHALVSGLSQSVPTIATGWTHKYEQLMRLYQCPDSLVSPLDPERTLFDIIDAHTEDATRMEIIRRLQASADNHREASQRMWDDVRKILYDKR
jgi:polysaccharide pyruvyl transferase WcaK-like protein